MRILRTLDSSAGPILLSLVVALVLVPSATAYEVPSELNEVAHVYSSERERSAARHAEWDEDWASSFSWAYTNIRDDYTVLGPVVCAGALGVGRAEVPAWQQALGAMVLTHEAFHLRHWRFRRHEGKVECQALANFRDATRRLGATTAQAEALPLCAGVARLQGQALLPVPRSEVRHPALGSADDFGLTSPPRRGRAWRVGT